MDDFKVSNEGQITLPPNIRRFLKLEPGDEVRFEIRNGNVVLLAAPSETIADPITALEKFQALYKQNQKAWERPLSLKEQREARGWDDIDDKLFEEWEKEIAREKQNQ